MANNGKQKKTLNKGQFLPANNPFNPFAGTNPFWFYDAVNCCCHVTLEKWSEKNRKKTLKQKIFKTY